MMRRVLAALLLLLSTVPAWTKVDKALLSQLDGYLKNRELFVEQKETRLEAGRQRWRQAQTPVQQYDAAMSLADEFFSYRFDSTQTWLKTAIGLAEASGDAVRRDKATIRLAYLYTKAGNYMEAYDRLYLKTDTTRLDPSLKADYLEALYEFSRDISGNSGMVENLNIPAPATYRRQLYPLLPEGSERSLRLQLGELMEQHAYRAADTLAHQLLAMVPPQSHQAAIYYYELSEIAWQEKRFDEQENYLALSAQCDIVNAIKDYASLAILSQSFIITDVDRSFHYLRIAQEDALQYNSKLRPWQISQFFLVIENEYEQRHEALRKRQIVWNVLLAVLVLLLAVAIAFVARQTRRLRLAHDRLREANQVKEGYITKFLGDLSASVAQIRQDENRIRKLLKQGRSEELMRSLSLSTRADDALENFYRIFDETFLGLYPDFVERFNALLRPEARIYPKKEGRLNTELRIFALIRLGIEDSKEIASLLHYSLSTIYNYKVSVKNGALRDREHFEEQVKQI